MVIVYTLENISQHDLTIVPWGREYATNWIQGFLDKNYDEGGLHSVRKVLYELEPTPKRSDFVTLRPKGTFEHRFKAKLVKKHREAGNREYLALDFEDSEIVLAGPGHYLLQGRFEGKDRWSQIGKQNFGFSEVFVGEIRSEKIAFILTT